MNMEFSTTYDRLLDAAVDTPSMHALILNTDLSVR